MPVLVRKRNRKGKKIQYWRWTMMWTSKKRKTMKRRIGTIILVAVLQFFFLPVFHVYCQAAISPERSTRPKIGLVLSGGGARGAAHIGGIKARGVVLTTTSKSTGCRPSRISRTAPPTKKPPRVSERRYSGIGGFIGNDLVWNQLVIMHLIH